MLMVNILWIGLWIVPQAFATDSCAGQSFGYRSVDPADPHSYFLCLGFLGQIKNTCPEGLRFNVHDQSCVHGGKPSPGSSIADKDTTIHQNVFIDRPLIFNFFGNLWGSPSPSQSQPQLPISTDQHQGALPSESLSALREVISPTQENNPGTDETPSTSTRVESRCRFLPNGAYIRDLKKCGVFYVCANGNAITRCCPEGLYFDVEKSLCNFPSMVDCSEELPTLPTVPLPTLPPPPERTTKASSTQPSSTEPSSTSSSSSTDPSAESSTEPSDSSSEEPSSTEPSPESSTKANDSSSEDPSSTEPSPESSTEPSDSSSEEPSSTEPSSTEPSPESSTEPNNSSSEEPSSREPSPESSTEPNNSSSEEPSATEPSPESSTEPNNSSSEDPSSTEPSAESSTEPNNSSSEEPSSTEPSPESSTEPNNSSSEVPSSTEPSSTEPSPESSTEPNDSSSEEPSSTEPSPESSTEPSDSSSEEPSSTEPPPESSTEPNNSSSEVPSSTEPSSTEPSPESSTEPNNSSSEEPSSTEPSAESSTEPNSASSEELFSAESSTKSSSEQITQISSSNEKSAESSLVIEAAPSLPVRRPTEPISLSNRPVIDGSKTETLNSAGIEQSQYDRVLGTTSESSSKFQARTDCSFFPTGTYLRDPTSCNKFFVCAYGKAIPRRCPSILNFDIRKKVCNFPSLVDCSIDDVQVSVLKKLSEHAARLPESSTVKKVEQKSIFDCTSLPNGEHVRDLNSCSKFYVCANGRSIPRQCPKGLNFDITRKVCNFPSRVDCSIVESKASKGRRQGGQKVAQSQAGKGLPVRYYK
ncbi:flocculation protein FLO11 isoform X2 [Drosophila subobscura]|uniref:flocculation protein FLO11 isoform X2 n=1 Tax=Drosophila subobscura TaxID=7241 RepID=UPI00155A8A74|nr:flocculation protein FLO11 isoform X2 [Drosophila subobscura]